MNTKTNPRHGVENTRQKGWQNNRKVLTWLNEHRFSTPSVLGERLGIGRAAGLKIVNRLIEMGLLSAQISGSNVGYRTKVVDPASGKVTLSRHKIVTLTEAGKFEAQRLSKRAGAPWARQIRNHQTLRHDLICQRLLISELNGKDGSIPTGYSGGHSIRASSSSSKEPDGILWFGKTKVAIEVELTAKAPGYPRTSMLTKIMADVESNRFHQVWIYFDSDKTCKAYEDEWDKRYLRRYQRQNGKIVPRSDYYKITDEVWARVHFEVSELLQVEPC